MLHDFKKAKELLVKYRNQYIESRAMTYAGVLSQIQKREMYEGDGFLNQYENENFFESDVKKIMVSREINRKRLTMDPLYRQSILDSFSRQLGQAQFKLFLDTVDKATELTENIITRKGKFTALDFLKSLEAYPLEFNKDGKPVYPQFICGNEMMGEIKEAIDKFESDLGLESRRNELLIKKKKEFDDRKANRKLVE